MPPPTRVTTKKNKNKNKNMKARKRSFPRSPQHPSPTLTPPPNPSSTSSSAELPPRHQLGEATRRIRTMSFTDSYPDTQTKLQILQQNLRKSLHAQNDFCGNGYIDQFDLILIQEPYIDFQKFTRATHHFHAVYPSTHLKGNAPVTRAITLINKRIPTNSWKQTLFDSGDVVSVDLMLNTTTIHVYNVYNDCEHDETIEALEGKLTESRLRAERNARSRVCRLEETVVAGDFNRHHPMWDEERNAHLFTTHNLERAEMLIDLLTDAALEMALPKNIPTLRASATGNYTRPDNVFLTHNLINRTISCNVVANRKPVITDHWPILTVLDLETEIIEEEGKRNYRKVNWPEFKTALEEKLARRAPPNTISNIPAFNNRLSQLYADILLTIEEHVPMPKLHKHSKRWWTPELTRLRREVNRACGRAWKYKNLETDYERQHKEACKVYKEAIEEAKAERWRDFLEGADARTIWQIQRLAASSGTDGGKTRTPSLKNLDSTGRVTSMADTNEDKSNLFFKTFFPMPDPETEHLRTIPDTLTPPPLLDPPQITRAQIQRAIRRTKSFKAPGTSGILNVVYQKCEDILSPYLLRLFRASIRLRYYPNQWKLSKVVILRKVGKPDYGKAKAYRPIALLDTMAKILSSCVAENLIYVIEANQLIPNTHFGGRPGKTTTDSLHYKTKYIFDNWRKGNDVAAVYLDISGAYPSVHIPRLIHNLRMRRIPEVYVNWIEERLKNRRTTLNFDDFTSEPFDILTGIDQGCPLSGTLYIIYNAELVEIALPLGATLNLGFQDDVSLMAPGANLEEANEKLREMLIGTGGALNWAKSHASIFEIDKTALIGYSRKLTRDPTGEKKRIPVARPPLRLGNVTIQATKSHTFLGVILDQELRFKEQMARAIEKGTKWVQQIRRLAKTNMGVTPRYLRQLYTTVAIPRMLYAVDIFCSPVALIRDHNDGTSTQGFVNKIASIQRMAAIAITGALRTAPTDFLNAEANLLPADLLILKLCHRAATRLLTIPNTHPLHPHVTSASKRLVKRLPSPLHRIFFTCKYESQRVETIQNIRRAPSWYYGPPISFYLFLILSFPFLKQMTQIAIIIASVLVYHLIRDYYDNLIRNGTTRNRDTRTTHTSRAHNHTQRGRLASPPAHHARRPTIIIQPSSPIGLPRPIPRWPSPVRPRPIDTDLFAYRHLFPTRRPSQTFPVAPPYSQEQGDTTNPEAHDRTDRAVAPNTDKTPQR